MPADVTPVAPRKSNVRLWTLRSLLMLAAPALCFGTLEAVLRFAGAGYPTAFVVRDPGAPALLIDNYRFAWRFFPRALARSPQPLRAVCPKPAGTLRVVVLGGSAAMGDPDPAYGLPRMLESLLRARHPQQNIEVLNAAVTAINSHVVLPVARNCLALEPDLFVVYMGNNEVNGPFGAAAVFGQPRAPLAVIRASLTLQQYRTGQMLSRVLVRESTEVPAQWGGGLRMFLDQQIGEGDSDLERVYANFESNYRDLLALAGGAGVPVVFSTVAVNLADFPPLASRKPDPEGLEGARQAALASDWNALLAQAPALTRSTPEHAEAHYLLALAQMHAGRTADAGESFSRARDLDTLRFRADSRINGIIRNLPAGSGACVDTAAALSTTSSGGSPGGADFFEHVHFTPKGNHAVATLLAGHCERLLSLPAPSPSAEWSSLDDCLQVLGYTPFHERELLREVRARLSQAPFSQQFAHAQRLQELDKAIQQAGDRLSRDSAQQALQQFEALLTRRPDDWQIRDKFAILLDSLGQLPEAAAQRQRIARQLPHDATANLQLGSALNRIENWSEAEQALRRAIVIRAEHPRAWNSLGICLSRQSGRHDEAKQCFARAVAVHHGYAEAYHNWGLVLGNEGALDDAAQRFRQALEADPQYVPALQSLGQALVKLQAYEDAAAAYSRLAELLPDDPAAHLNRGLAYLRVPGHRTTAVESLRKVLLLDPGNATASRALAELNESR